jgi:hypothetical protein
MFLHKLLSEQRLKLGSNMINCNFIKIYDYFVSRLLSHPEGHLCSAEHSLGNASSTRFCVSLQYKMKSDQWEPSCCIRTDIRDKANGIFCKFDITEMFLSPSQARLAVRSRATHTAQAALGDVTSGISLISVSPHCAAWPLCFYSPAKLQICYWRHS